MGKDCSLPTVLVDKKRLDQLAAQICCLEKASSSYEERITENETRITEIEEGCCDPDNPPIPGTDCDPICTKIGFYADSGIANADQILLWNRIQLLNPDMLLMGGDNTYTNPATCEEQQADAEIFAPYRQLGMLFPALGNHDLDVDSDAACHNALYPYLPNNGRYYRVSFPERSLDIFVLNSGRQTGSPGTLVEPDGNDLNSVQYQWFVEQATLSQAKHKIVMFHHPWFSQQSSAVSGAQYLPEMDWKFENYGIDLVINGHNHLTVHHEWKGVNYVQASVSVQSARDFRGDQDQTYGLPFGAMVWQDDRNGLSGEDMMGYIELTDRAMHVRFVDTLDGTLQHEFGIVNDRPFICEFTEEPNCPCSYISYGSQ